MVNNDRTTHYRHLDNYNFEIIRTVIEKGVRNMSGKLLWTGLFFIVAVGPALQAFGSNSSTNVLAIVGAILMLIGIILYWFDK